MKRRFTSSTLKSRKFDLPAWTKGNHLRGWSWHYGITFQAFQRMNKINTAFRKIQNGDDVSSVAYESGYSSLSGFSDSYKALVEK